jgi:tellurite resistance protein
MSRDDFAQRVGRELIQQSVLRHIVPVASVLVSAAWNQIVLRRYAQQVHATVKQRVAIVQACRGVQLGDAHSARMILDGAWLLATADGDIEHHEALALSTLIDSLPLPQQISVKEASFPDDEEPWFEAVLQLAPAERTMLLNVLASVAISDGELSTPERRFFRRLGKVFEVSLDLPAIDKLAERLREGDFQEQPPSALWTPALA